MGHRDLTNRVDPYRVCPGAGAEARAHARSTSNRGRGRKHLCGHAWPGCPTSASGNAGDRPGCGSWGHAHATAAFGEPASGVHGGTLVFYEESLGGTVAVIEQQAG